MDMWLGSRTNVLVSAQTLGQKWGEINGWTMGEGRLIDGQMSTLTDGWLAGELHDWAVDDGYFMFVSLYVGESGREC